MNVQYMLELLIIHAVLHQLDVGDSVVVLIKYFDFSRLDNISLSITFKLSLKLGHCYS